MTPLIYFNVFGQQITTRTDDLLKLEYVINSAAAAGFVQIHDSIGVPAAGAVPIKSYPTSASDQQYKDFTLAHLRIANCLYIAFSTTEATLTLGTGNNKFQSLTVEIEKPDQAVTVVGDLTTGIDSQTVWANGGTTQGLHNLRRIDYVNNGAAFYLMLFAHASSDGNVPIQEWLIPASTASFLDFGEKGLVPFAQTAAFGKRDGCYLVSSSTPGVRTITGAGNISLRSTYF